ncbi:MAG TPA: phosphatase PAP2 family protein [Nevskia sp.]|nr:phosphatase PAP2 family protein [Nevskia sp.]
MNEPAWPARLRAFRRLSVVELRTRRDLLPWSRPDAMRTLAWWMLAPLVVGTTWLAIGGYHAVFRPLNSPWALLPDWLAQSITFCGDTLYALVLLLLVARRFPQVLWLATCSGVVATVLSRGLKALVDSARPGAVLPPDSFHLVGPLYYTHSWPSGHTVTAFVAAASFSWFLPQAWLRWVLFALALLVGWSRVGVGAHWPLDVLGGMVIGTLSVFIGAVLARRTPWGTSAPAHLLSVLALAGCAVALLLRTPSYPLAWPLAHGTAVALLTLTVWEYVVGPIAGAFDHRSAIPRR